MAVNSEIDYVAADAETDMPTPSDKAREQMARMGLNAPSILSRRIETRTPEQIAEDRKTVAENVPILGDAMLAKEVADDVSEGNYASAALGTAALGVGFLPAGDILNKPIKAAAKKFRKQDAEVANKMLKDVDSIETWKKQNPNPKPQKQNPDVEKAANDLLEGNITGKQYRSVVKENMPIVKIEEVPEVPSFTEIVGALNKDKSAKGILGLNKTVKDGTRVASRLDIPAYEKFDKWVVSVHDAYKKGRESLDGDIMGYGKTAILKNVEFKGMSQGAARISSRREDKGTIARIFGDYYNAEPENVAEYAAQAMKDKNWTQVGYNPFRHGFFYDKDTGMPVKSAEEVIQVGPLVLAKNAQKMKISEAKQVSPKGGIKIRTGKPIEGLQNLKETKTVFNEGGAVMKKQMDLFEPVEGAFDEGGLMDEGGSVDPESGNDVPVGSTQEEVRDDIPAQLSEGEFVLPADVVRFHGLEKIMALRDEAKAGLAKMEAMGQMGNSDEATIPDGIPFSMDDLEMEDDGVQDFAQGGVVQAQAGTFVMPQTNPTQASQFTGYQPQYTPYTPPAMPAATAGYTPPMQQATPVSTTATPTFTGLTGIATPSTGGYDEMKTYVNDAGMEMQIPFKDGSPIYPIPEGFKVKTEEVETATTTTTTGTGVDTSQTQSSSDEDSAPPKYTTTDPTGIGYNRAKVKSTALKDVLTESAKSQMRSFFSNSLMSTAGKELGLVGTKMTSSAVLGGILDDFREGNVSFETGIKEGSYTNTVNLESLTKEQGDIIADVFKSVSEKMSGLYTDQDEVTGEEINLKPAEVNARVVDMAKELDIKTTVGDTENTKRRETLEREIATELARREKKETSKQAAMETGEQRREEQKQAAADASKYGISATRADGSKKSAEELRGEISTELTNRAKQAEAEAAARRTQRSGGDDDGGGAPDQSTYAGSQAYGAETFGISGLAKGGLVEQMKQSGLASKK